MDKVFEAKFQKHLKEEHSVSPFSEYLKEIVYGGNDGIVTTFAVVAGFTGANSGEIMNITFIAVLIFGLANLLADGAAMGLGNFLSVRSEQKVYKNAKDKEKREIQNNKEFELLETQHILQKKGFSKEDSIKLSQMYSKNEDYWTEFMMEHELEMSNPERDNPLFKGIATFISFVFFGFIPLIPYLILDEIAVSFIVSCGFTLLALVLLGLLRWKVTKEKLIRCLAEVIIVGGGSAMIAFVVGLMFRE